MKVYIPPVNYWQNKIASAKVALKNLATRKHHLKTVHVGHLQLLARVDIPSQCNWESGQFEIEKKINFISSRNVQTNSSARNCVGGCVCLCTGPIGLYFIGKLHWAARFTISELSQGSNFVASLSHRWAQFQEQRDSNKQRKQKKKRFSANLSRNKVENFAAEYANGKEKKTSKGAGIFSRKKVWVPYRGGREFSRCTIAIINSESKKQKKTLRQNSKQVRWENKIT